MREVFELLLQTVCPLDAMEEIIPETINYDQAANKLGSWIYIFPG